MVARAMVDDRVQTVPALQRCVEDWTGPLHVPVNYTRIMAAPERAPTLGLHRALANSARVVSVGPSGHLTPSSRSEPASSGQTRQIKPGKAQSRRFDERPDIDRGAPIGLIDEVDRYRWRCIVIKQGHDLTGGQRRNRLVGQHPGNADAGSRSGDRRVRSVHRQPRVDPDRRLSGRTKAPVMGVVEFAEGYQRVVVKRRDVRRPAARCQIVRARHQDAAHLGNLQRMQRTVRQVADPDDARADAALVFGRKVLETRGHVSDADLAAVRLAGFSEAQVIEIVANVAVNVLTNYINNVAETDIGFPVVRAAEAA